MPNGQDALATSFDREFARNYTTLRSILTAKARAFLRARLGFFRPEQVEEEANDLIGDVLLARANYDPSRPFIPWACRVAMNRAADRSRQARARQNRVRGGASFTSEEVFEALITAALESRADKAERKRSDESEARIQFLQRELALLPEKEQAAIRLRYLEERDYADVIAVLRLSNEAVARGVVCRGLKRLSRRLQQAADCPRPAPATAPAARD